jgi:integrase
MIRRSFQKGHISSRKTKTHGVVFDIRYRVRGANGTWVQRCGTLNNLGTGKEARANAEAHLASRLREANPGNSPAMPSNITLREFAEGQWEQYLDRRGAKPSTRASYRSYVTGHLIPEFGELRLVDIAPVHVGEMLAKKRGAGLSARTVYHFYRLLDTMFHVAADNDLIERSPVWKNHRPDFLRANKAAWTPDQVRRIIANTAPRYQALVTTAALLGARIGEILGLEWKQVDFENREIRISQALWRGRLQTTKTEYSVRVVPMYEYLLLTLRQHKEQSLRTDPGDFVFCHPDGRPFNPDVLRCDVLYPALRAAGLPRGKRAHGWHAFRHTASTLIYQRTRDLKSARMFLGHADEKTTELYTHVSKANPEAAHALEEVIFGDLLQTVTKTTLERPYVKAM